MRRMFGRMPRRRAALVVVTVLATLLAAGLTGCTAGDGHGGGGAPAGGTPSATPADPVAASFNDYAAAVNAQNGDRSADLMSSASRQYYDHLRALALDASRAVLQQQPLVDQITVLTFRQRMPVGVLRTASAHDLVSRAVKLGLISQNNAAGVSVQQIRITGTTASARLVEQGEPGTTPLSYPVRFVFEDQRWRFDVTSLLGAAQDQMVQAAKVNQLSDSALVEKVMQARTGSAAAAQALWTPLRRG